jgi:hypothetical protein
LEYYFGEGVVFCNLRDKKILWNVEVHRFDSVIYKSNGHKLNITECTKHICFGIPMDLFHNNVGLLVSPDSHILFIHFSSNMKCPLISLKITCLVSESIGETRKPSEEKNEEEIWRKKNISDSILPLSR